jgi:hypothetical protein
VETHVLGSGTGYNDQIEEGNAFIFQGTAVVRMRKTTVRFSAPVAGVFEPTQQARRVANVNPRLGNVLGNNRAGANDGVIADRDRKNGGICSNAYTIPKSCSSPRVRICGRAPGNEQIIDEHGAMRNEAFVSDRYELTDE